MASMVTITRADSCAALSLLSRSRIRV